MCKMYCFAYVSESQTIPKEHFQMPTVMILEVSLYECKQHFGIEIFAKKYKSRRFKTIKEKDNDHQTTEYNQK